VDFDGEIDGRSGNCGRDWTEVGSPCEEVGERRSGSIAPQGAAGFLQIFMTVILHLLSENVGAAPDRSNERRTTSVLRSSIYQRLLTGLLKPADERSSDHVR